MRQMAFCSRHPEGKGQVWTVERQHDSLEIRGSRNRVHARQQNATERLENIKFTLRRTSVF